MGDIMAENGDGGSEILLTNSDPNKSTVESEKSGDASTKKE